MSHINFKEVCFIMSAAKKERQKLVKYWENQIKQWSESGLSQSEHCRVSIAFWETV